MSQYPPLSAEESSMYPEPDSGLPYSKKTSTTDAPMDNNAKMAQRDLTDSAQHHTSDEDTAQPPKMTHYTDANQAQQNLALTA